jgi:hypothetical protein
LKKKKSQKDKNFNHEKGMIMIVKSLQNLNIFKGENLDFIE